MKTLDGEQEKLVGEALQREYRLLESRANMLRQEINVHEKEYRMSSDEFVTKFEGGELGDNQTFFEWWGLIEGLKKTEAKIVEITAVLR